MLTGEKSSGGDRMALRNRGRVSATNLPRVCEYHSSVHPLSLVRLVGSTVGKSGTQRNLEPVRGLYESFGKGDIERIGAIMSPEIQLRLPRGFADGGSVFGFDEIVDTVFSRKRADWAHVSVVPERYVTDGETVVAFYTWSGTTRETGKSVAFEGAHVFDFDDGTVARWTSYADTPLFNAPLTA